jgi:hypothetical protein
MTTPTQRIVASAIATAKMIPAIALTPGNSLVRGLTSASPAIVSFGQGKVTSRSSATPGLRRDTLHPFRHPRP